MCPHVMRDCVEKSIAERWEKQKIQDSINVYQCDIGL